MWDGGQPAPMVPEDWEVACGRALMQDHHLVRVPAGGTYERQAQAGTYLLEAGKTYTLGACWHSQRRGSDTFTLPLWEGVLASERIPFLA